MAKNSYLSARVEDELYAKVKRWVDIQSLELGIHYTVNDYITKLVKNDLHKNRLL